MHNFLHSIMTLFSFSTSWYTYYCLNKYSESSYKSLKLFGLYLKWIQYNVGTWTSGILVCTQNYAQVWPGNNGHDGKLCQRWHLDQETTCGKPVAGEKPIPPIAVWAEMAVWDMAPVATAGYQHCGLHSDASDNAFQGYLRIQALRTPEIFSFLPSPPPWAPEWGNLEFSGMPTYVRRVFICKLLQNSKCTYDKSAPHE